MGTYKMTKFVLLIATIVLSLTGCISEWDKMLDTDYPDYETVSSTKNITDKTFDVDITKYHKNLNLHFNIKLPADFQFPTDSSGQRKLSKTSLLIAFYYKGQLISTSTSKLSQRHFILFRNAPLVLKTKDINLENITNMDINIPMYIFHEIPKGEQELEVYIYQEKMGCDYFYDEENNYYEEEIHDTTIIEKRIKFKVEIPEIYETRIVSGGFKLRNDDVFSPSGMDFSFGNGYPDIYWQLNYTVNDEKINNEVIFTSNMQKNAVSYDYQDTVYIHHYGQIDNIYIGIYDHDNVGRDEYIDSWEGDIDELIEKNTNPTQNLVFNKLEWFKIHAENIGICN
ncbi:MAG: hypothetical protein ABIJ97_07880 [Bacteroidota bacterium]